MRVMVSEIDRGHASTPQAGARLHELIEPALGRGEQVVLDFDGVRHCDAPFLGASVGRLIEEDKEERLPPLLRYENLQPLWQGTLESVTSWAVRRRRNPAAAAAMDELLRTKDYVRD